MSIEDDELLNEFVIESQEHLASVETNLLSLESQQESIDVTVVNRVFRAIHSIKGTAGFLGLSTVESLAHREEEVLNGMRNNEIRPTKAVISTLLRATDRLKGLMDAISSSNDEDVSDHIKALEALMIEAGLQVSGAGSPTASELFAEMAAIPTTPTVSTPSPVPATPVVAASTETISDAQLSEAVAIKPVPSSGASVEAIREFIIESNDNLDQLERDLVALERDPSDDKLLNSIFRNIHTIKGTAGFLAYGKVEKVSHSGENILGSLRAGQIVFDAAISTALFSMIDCVRRLLSEIERNGGEGSENCDTLIERLDILFKERSSGKPSESQANVAPKPTAAVASPVVTEEASSNVQAKAVNSAPVASLDSNGSLASESTIRVDVALLDKLMTRVGELVLARNQILQFTSALGNSDLISTSQRLNLITTELQEGVMKTRMQPIGNVWSKFPRLVRDLASICGKEVRIEMEGKDTELDKTIIEAIKDPLTHLVRNTVDHGIEKPDVRVQKGKPMEGCLYLRAFHEGGQVNIEISDDGAGLNLDKIKEKAIQKGLITADQASRLQERDICHLIFLPGFSTADKVSNVSGRGVGMDVVKTNIEKIGGTVDLQTRTGNGTTIKIKIPLTLAIIPALVVTNDRNRFAIPQVNLLELVRLEGEQAKENIEWIQGSPVYRLRGRLLPLVYLSKILKTQKPQSEEGDAINIVVLRADERHFGLVVDRINDTEEIVVKPLCNTLKGIPVYSGATIMGDGKVALILDVLGIAENSHANGKSKNKTVSDSSHRQKEGGNKTQSLLILGIGQQKRVAITISQVARLERIPVNDIEFANDREVVQYRGEILPLARLKQMLGHCSADEDVTELNVVVFTQGQKSVGIVVDHVLDTVEATLDNPLSAQSEGVIASYVIQGSVTDLIDLPKLMQGPFGVPGLSEFAHA